MFSTVNALAGYELHRSVCCLLVVPHVARLSRLCRGRPRQCSRRLPAGRALFVFLVKISNCLFVRFLFFCFFFSNPLIIFALVFSLPPINSRNSDPGSHSRLFSPPTQYGSCLAFLSRQDFSSFFPRRLASNCAYPR